MAPLTLRVFSASRSALRSTAAINGTSARGLFGAQLSARGRFYSEKSPDDAPPPAGGPTRDVLPHINDETSAISDIMGEAKPDANEQGTPISEILERDEKAREMAPEVLKHPEEDAGDKMTQETPNDTQFISRVLNEHLNYPKVFYPTYTTQTLDPENPQSKYPLPPVPVPATNRLRERYPEIVEQVTNMLMRHGKKARAQSYMEKIFNILRTKPAPNRGDHLLVGSPDLDSLPLNPILYLQTAIDSVAPLVRIKNIRGSGGFANQIPIPLNQRQRRRTAIQWMLASVNSKSPSMMRLPEKFADEIVAVVEGRSGAWNRRTAVHKMAIAARANVKV